MSEILDLKPARIYSLTREKKFSFTVKIVERQYRYCEVGLRNWIENGGKRESEVNHDEK